MNLVRLVDVREVSEDKLRNEVVVSAVWGSGGGV